MNATHTIIIGALIIAWPHAVSALHPPIWSIIYDLGGYPTIDCTIVILACLLSTTIRKTR